MPSTENSVDALMAQMRESYLRELPEKFNELESLVLESSQDRGGGQAFGLGAVSLVVVEDGLQAMERLLLERFDFYVRGNQLPRLNGPSIVTAIRSNSGINRNAPCILLSSHIPEVYGRKTDPDFVITRDNRFVEHLDSAVNQLLAMVRD